MSLGLVPVRVFFASALFLNLVGSHGPSVDADKLGSAECVHEKSSPQHKSSPKAAFSPVSTNRKKQLVKRQATFESLKSWHRYNCLELKNGICVFIYHNQTYPYTCPYEEQMPFNSFVKVLPKMFFPIWMPVVGYFYGNDVVFRWWDPNRSWRLPYNNDYGFPNIRNKTFSGKVCLIYHNASFVEPVNCNETHVAVCAYKYKTRKSNRCTRHSNLCTQIGYNTTECLCLDNSGSAIPAEFDKMDENHVAMTLLATSGRSFCYIGLRRERNRTFWASSKKTVEYEFFPREVKFDEGFVYGAISKEGWILKKNKNESTCMVTRKYLRNDDQGNITLTFNDDARGNFRFKVTKADLLIYDEDVPLVFCYTDANSESIFDRIEYISKHKDADNNLIGYFNASSSSAAYYWCEAIFYGAKNNKTKRLFLNEGKDDYVMILKFPSRTHPITPDDIKRFRNTIRKTAIADLSVADFILRFHNIVNVDKMNSTVTINFHFTRTSTHPHMDYDTIRRFVKLKFNLVAFRSSSHCMKKTSFDQRIKLNVTWPTTMIGEEGYSVGRVCLKHDGSFMSRKCRGNYVDGGEWSKLDEPCYSISTIIETLLRKSEPAKFISLVFRMVNDTKQLTIEAINSVVLYLEGLEKASSVDMRHFVEIIDRLLYIPEDTLDEAEKQYKVKTRILYIAKHILSIRGYNGELFGDNFGIISKILLENMVKTSKYSIDYCETTKFGDERSSDIAVILGREVLDHIKAGSLRIVIIVYNTSTLFNSDLNIETITPIVHVSFVDTESKNVSGNISIISNNSTAETFGCWFWQGRWLYHSSSNLQNEVPVCDFRRFQYIAMARYSGKLAPILEDLISYGTVEDILRRMVSFLRQYSARFKQEDLKIIFEYLEGLNNITDDREVILVVEIIDAIMNLDIGIIQQAQDCYNASDLLLESYRKILRQSTGQVEVLKKNHYVLVNKKSKNAIKAVLDICGCFCNITFEMTNKTTDVAVLINGPLDDDRYIIVVFFNKVFFNLPKIISNWFTIDVAVRRDTDNPKDTYAEFTLKLLHKTSDTGYQTYGSWICHVESSGCWKERNLKHLYVDIGIKTEDIRDLPQDNTTEYTATNKAYLEIILGKLHPDIRLNFSMLACMVDRTTEEDTSLLTRGLFHFKDSLIEKNSWLSALDYLMSCSGTEDLYLALLEKSVVECVISKSQMSFNPSYDYTNITYLQITATGKDAVGSLEVCYIDDVSNPIIASDLKNVSSKGTEVYILKPNFADIANCAVLESTSATAEFFTLEDGNGNMACELDTCYFATYEKPRDVTFKLKAMLNCSVSPEEKLKRIRDITDQYGMIDAYDLDLIAMLLEKMPPPKTPDLDHVVNIINNLMRVKRSVLRRAQQKFRSIRKLLLRVNEIVDNFSYHEKIDVQGTTAKFGILICDTRKHRMVEISGSTASCTTESSFSDADVVVEIVTKEHVDKIVCTIFFNDALFAEENPSAPGAVIVGLYSSHLEELQARYFFKEISSLCVYWNNTSDSWSQFLDLPSPRPGYKLCRSSMPTYYTTINVTKNLESVANDRTLNCYDKLSRTQKILEKYLQELSPQDLPMVSEILESLSVTVDKEIRLVMEIVNILAGVSKTVLVEAQNRFGALGMILNDVDKILKDFPRDVELECPSMSIKISTNPVEKCIAVECFENRCVIRAECSDDENNLAAVVRLNSTLEEKIGKTIVTVYRDDFLFLGEDLKHVGIILSAEVVTNGQPAQIYLKNRDTSKEKSLCAFWENNPDTFQRHWKVDWNHVSSGNWLACSSKTGTGIPTTLISVNVTDSLNDILNSSKSFEEKLNDLADIIDMDTSNLKSLDVFIISKILALVGQENVTNPAEVALTHRIINGLLTINGSVLHTSQTEHLATDRILHFVDRMLISSQDDGTLKYVGDNCATIVLDLKTANVSGLLLKQWDGNETIFESVPDGVDVEDIFSTGEFITGIYVDHELRLQIEENEEPVRLMLTLFAIDSLFVDPDDRKTTDHVISSILMEGLQDPLRGFVSVLFRVETYPKSDQRSCNFWDYQNDEEESNSVRGHWSKDGVIKLANNTVICKYDHLTHFGLLVDSSSTEFIKANSGHFLDIITNVNCTLSLIGLLGIMLTAFLFENWRRNTGNQILMNFSCAIAMKITLLYVSDWFDYRENKTFCYIIGASLHFSVLSEFCWMLIIAILQFKRFVQVLGARPKYVLLKACICGWVFPAIPVILVVTIDVDSYTVAMDLCYPTKFGLYLGVWLPMLVIITINTIIFAFIIYNVCHNNTEAKELVSHEALFQWRLALLLFSLLGLTWVFAFLGLVDDTLVSARIFIILSSLQGFIMFLFFIVCNKSTRFLYMQAFKYWLYTWS